jgi:hypothetical protein
MTKRITFVNVVALITAAVLVFACKDSNDDGCGRHHDSDTAQTAAQEKILAEGNAIVGMPAIHNFRERKLLKDIYELRDQDGLVTFTYLFSEQTGRLTFFCNSIGYGIPAATQFTSPQKIGASGQNYGYAVLPQADPNGLFSPSSAEGTWVLCADQKSKDARPVYIEPRVVVSPFKIDVENPVP